MENNNGKFNLNDKLISLVEDGLSIEDAASCLGLDPDHAKEVILFNKSLNSSIKDKDDPDKIIEENKPKAIKALIRIGLDNSIENISARVAALRAIVEHKSYSTEAEDKKIQEMYKKMTEVSSRYEKELSIKKDSTTVVIPNTNTETLSKSISTDFERKFNEIKKKEESLDYAV